MSDRPRVLLSDANVLIDYLNADASILARIAESIGPLHVLREVLDEIDGLNLARCRDLGITVVNLETEALLELQDLPRRLSPRDRLLFLTCRQRDWVCLTNDRALRRICEENGIRVQWGLEPMVDLVEAGRLPRARALSVAQAIHESNRYHISEAILERFRRRLEQ